jgi:hypothetical protein
MNMPQCFYQKAFWVSMAVLVSVITSVLGLAWGMIEENRDVALDNKIELEKRADSIGLIPQIYKNQIKICTALGAECE